MGDLDDVAAQAATESGTDPALLGDFLATIEATTQTGRSLTRGQLQHYRSSGQQAARSGVALRALLDLYLSAARLAWPQLPAVASSDGSEVGKAGAGLIGTLDDVIGALTEGYQLARQRLVREQESARREFVDDLLAGQGDVASLTQRGHTAGLELTGPHAVVIVRAERAFVDTAPVLADLERAVLGRKGDADALVASKQGDLVVVFAAPDEAAVEEVMERIAARLRPVDGGREPAGVRLHRTAAVGRWQLAVGRAYRGPIGVRRSYDEAREALELAARLDLSHSIVRSADLLVYRVLLRDREAITDLVEAVLAPLRTARGGAAPLVATLRAYFDANGNAAETGRLLQLSVRAVTYRLQRIAELTGHDPARAQDRFALHAAVLGAQLLNWS